MFKTFNKTQCIIILRRYISSVKLLSEPTG